MLRNRIPCQLSFSYHLESLVFISIRNISFIFTSSHFLFSLFSNESLLTILTFTSTVKLRVNLPLQSLLYPHFPALWDLIPPKTETIQVSTSSATGNPGPLEPAFSQCKQGKSFAEQWTRQLLKKNTDFIPSLE